LRTFVLYFYTNHVLEYVCYTCSCMHNIVSQPIYTAKKFWYPPLVCTASLHDAPYGKPYSPWLKATALRKVLLHGFVRFCCFAAHLLSRLSFFLNFSPRGRGVSCNQDYKYNHKRRRNTIPETATNRDLIAFFFTGKKMEDALKLMGRLVNLFVRVCMWCVSVCECELYFWCTYICPCACLFLCVFLCVYGRVYVVVRELAQSRQQ